MEYYPLKIISRKEEVKDCCTFYLEPLEKDKDQFIYKTAQFLTFKLRIEASDFVRSYSLSSSPLLNEPLATTIKRVKGGKVSEYILNNLKEGDTILSQKPLGEFYQLPKNLEPRHYMLFAAGIGITPLFSILKTVLNLSPQDKVTLVFSSPTADGIIYKTELDEFQKKYSEQLKVHHVFSKTQGRLDESKIRDFLNIEDATPAPTEFYLCGPKEYMDLVKKTLKKNHISEEAIFTEDFKVVPVFYPQPSEDSVFYEAPHAKEGEPKEIQARIDGEVCTIPASREKSILDQLLDKGYNVPFSCASGNCMTCMARLKEGKVFQIEEGILDEDNRKNLELLTCQSYPLSQKVFVDYDDF